MKRLTKSRENRIVSGVLGGIADYIGIDVTILRVVYVVLSFCSTVFPGIVLYIALALIMPEGKAGNRQDHQKGYYRTDNFSSKRERKEAEKVDEDWSDF